jgi:endonuclease/exonuclease/phosphatase family metal-dependent hydrolase
VSLLVRTWNLFHGNADPPERRAYLEQMVRLVTADAPDVVCLQEVPVWALPHLGAWSGMTASGAVAARPRLGNAELGRAVTDLHHGRLRSAFTGQANAILVAQRLRVTAECAYPISRRGEGERRVCQAVRLPDTALVANFHATAGHAGEQVLRAAAIADGLALPGEPVLLCGDANLRPGDDETYAELRSWGFSDPAPGIDQILVRGLTSSTPTMWPESRRRIDGRLLSDHLPVELTVG